MLSTDMVVGIQSINYSNDDKSTFHLTIPNTIYENDKHKSSYRKIRRVKIRQPKPDQLIQFDQVFRNEFVTEIISRMKLDVYSKVHR